jgi:UDP-N-acetylmuramyl tripeptide synthase
MPDCPQCATQPTTLTPPHVLQIAALNATIADRDAAIVARDASIRGLLIAGAELTATVAARDATIVEMQAVNDDLKHTIERYEKQWPKNTCPKCGYQPEKG